MHPANYEYLKEKIIRTDIDKHLVPLMWYKGSNSFGRITRLWNFMIICMDSGVEGASDAVRLSHNPDYTHLCGTIKPIQSSSLPGFLGRLLDSRAVTDNIPGLTEYVREFAGWKFTPIPVSQFFTDAYHRHRCPPWRTPDFSAHEEEMHNRRLGRSLRRLHQHGLDYDAKVARRLQRELDRLHALEKTRADRIANKAERERLKAERKMLLCEPRENLVYPFLLHKPRDGDAEAALMLEVNNAVPRYLPAWLRADICQDLIVGILSGEIRRDELHGSVKEFTAKVLKMHPIKYGPLSIDAPIFDEGNETILSRMTEDEYRRRLGW